MVDVIFDFDLKKRTVFFFLLILQMKLIDKIQFATILKEYDQLNKEDKSNILKIKENLELFHPHIAELIGDKDKVRKIEKTMNQMFGSKVKKDDSDQDQDQDQEEDKDKVKKDDLFSEEEDQVKVEAKKEKLCIKKGDIIMLKDTKEIAEILDVDYEDELVYVSWLVEFKEIFENEEEPSPFDILSKQIIRPHPGTVILTSAKQNLDDPFTFEDLSNNNIKKIDLQNNPHIITDRRYFYNVGLVIPSTIAEFTPEDLLQFENQISEMPLTIKQFLRQEGGLWKRSQQILYHLESGNFSAKHSYFAEVQKKIPIFEKNEKIEGICVWCNLPRTLSFYYKAEDGTKLGMGCVCHEKYEHYISIRKFLTNLSNPKKMWSISDDQLEKLSNMVEKAEMHYADED